MIITIISALLMILIVQISVKNALFVKINKLWAIILSIILIAIYLSIFLLITDPESETIVNAISMFFALLSPLVVFRDVQKGQSFFIAFLIQGLISTVTVSIIWIASIFIKKNVNTQIIDLITDSSLLIICIVAVKNGVFSRVFNNITRISRGMKIMLLTAVWTSSILATQFSILFSEYSNMPWIQSSGLLAATLMILTVIMSPLLIINNIQSTYYRNLSDIMNKQVQTQLKHYEAMSKMNEDIAKFQHDSKNLRIGMISYLKQNDVPGALNYLETEYLPTASLTQRFKTGSVILDALLDDKQMSADLANASIGFDGAVPEKLINPADLCVIFGNALDNAIEECAKITEGEKKAISIQSSFSNGFLFIKIENPTAGNVKMVNGNVATTKEDKKSHGIGLQSIRIAVEKYSGVMDLAHENGIFSVAIDLDFHHNVKNDSKKGVKGS